LSDVLGDFHRDILAEIALLSLQGTRTLKQKRPRPATKSETRPQIETS
jgi:hypothetical protein